MAVGIETILPGVFTAGQRVAEGKNGIVFGRRRALVIDTGNDAGEGGAMADHIRAHGRQPEWVAFTHGHGDHVLGGGAFGGAEFFAHALTPDTMRRQVPRWAERAGCTAAEVAATLGWPTVTFSAELCLDLGERHVRFIHTPGHSADSVCAYLEEDRVLFGGDAVVTGIVPAFGDGDSRQLEASLRRLQVLDVAVLVGGHGPVLRGAARVRDWLVWLAAYLSGVRQFVAAELRAGRPPAEIPAALDYRTFVGDRLSPDQHGMPGRHQHTAQQMVQELLAARAAGGGV
ncbi:MAG: MBL fold metallo-hydrolase [Chloroflexi bacterium]|nr:MBL fold metallo-hydrolase [Chloroflexota bacterium]